MKIKIYDDNDNIIGTAAIFLSVVKDIVDPVRDAVLDLFDV